MNKKKLFLAVVLSIVLTVLLSFAVSAETTGGWIYNPDGSWSYMDSDGDLVKDEVGYEIDGDYYGFDAKGIMYDDGWVQPRKNNLWYDEEERQTWFYFGSDGRAKQGYDAELGYLFNWNGSVNTYDYEYDYSTGTVRFFVSDSAGRATELVGTGWIYLNDRWYYVASDEYDNRQLYTNGVYNIGGTNYGFGAGYLLSNELRDDSHWDEELGEWVYTDYFVNADGIAIRDGWCDVNGRWAYLNNGELYEDGVYNIGGVYYGFSGIYLAEEEGIYTVWHYDDDLGYGYDEYFYVTASGTAVRDGWVQYDGDYYYLDNGQLLQDGVYNIAGQKYYFNSWGGLSTNSYVDFYEDDYEHYAYATESGALLCNEWRYDGYYWEYYDANCDRVEDRAYTIGDSVYYFDYEGDMLTNVCRYSSEHESYLWFGENGVGTLVPTGWFLTPDGYMYFENGEFYAECIADIGGVKYAFGYNGYLYDYETYAYLWNGYEYAPYAINANGTVNFTPGWDMAGGSWVYIGENGVLKTEWQLIGDTWYYFGPYMYTNTTMTEYDEENDRVSRAYYFFSDGRYIDVTENGLYRISSSSTWYFENGAPVVGWRQINSNWYYFDYNMYADGSYSIGESVYYFDQDGVMQSGGWIDTGYDWLYADASGCLYTGPQTVDGTTYFFNGDGYLRTAGIWYWRGVRYLTNASGVVIAKSTDATGWYYDNGNCYYLDNGYFCYSNSAYQIGDQYYGFDYNGVMIADEIYNDRYYQANGAMYKDGWFMLDGYWYYANENGRLYNSLNKINGKFYYFRNYKLVIGTYIYNDEIVVTDGSGAVAYTQKFTEGWNLVTENGHGNYYYIEDGDFYYGWLGNYYLDPEMFAGGVYRIDDKAYYFNDNGVYATNGWVQYNEDDWVYAKADGTLYEDEWAFIGGNWYYFDGVLMASDTICHIDGKAYYFAENGIMATNGWVKREIAYTEDNIAERWAYAKADGTLYENEWAFIGGNWYYFDGYYIAYDGIWYVEGEYHKFAENGVWLGVVAEQEYTQGWHYIDGGWKYYQNGSFVNDTICKIDGTWYGFDYDGYLSTECLRDYGWSDGDLYYTNASGVVQDYTGWKLIDGRWYYFNTENKVETGWFTVGGTKYYADCIYNYNDKSYEIELLTGYHRINGKLYNFASGGACLGEVTTDGWYYIDDEWYYVQNGKLVMDDVISIGGVKYAFDYGTMLTDTIYYDSDADRYILLGKNGAQVTGGWYLLETEYSSEWYYVDSQGYLLTGTHIIGGVSYYFDFDYYY